MLNSFYVKQSRGT